jgi:UPF0755 protein
MSKRYWFRRLVALSLVVAGAALLVAALPVSCGGGSGQEGEAVIYIASGSSAVDIARQLKGEDVIDNERSFVEKAEELGIDQQLKPGTYIFERGEPVEDILDALASGEQAPEGVLTVPEGFSISDIATLVASKTNITRDQYLAQTAVSGRVLPLTGATAARDLEGFLFPSTYDLIPGITAQELVDDQLSAFSKQTATIDWGQAPGLGISEYQALIVASLVEREAKVPEERPLIAAVIYNRLADGMKLEVDATVQYSLGYWKGELTQEDLETDSPYNTRLYPGLPPGPICNPGLDSIKAALSPAPVNYLYYVATGDEAGHHFFTASYEEFLAMKGS